MNKHIKEILLILGIIVAGGIGMAGAIMYGESTKNNVIINTMSESSDTSADLISENEEINEISEINESADDMPNDANNNDDEHDDKIQVADGIYVGLKDNDIDEAYDMRTDTLIKFDGKDVNISGEGVTVRENSISITDEGVYILSGTLDNSHITVDADKKALVHLIFYGVDITCNSNIPLQINSADKVVITLADNSVNSINETSNFMSFDDDIKAAIYSKADLTINGNGVLNLLSTTANGISCKDNLRIAGGTINIDCINNGLKGDESVELYGGDITIATRNNGLKADSDKEGKGFIYIADCNLNITSDDDCLIASSAIIIERTSIYARCFGAYTKCDGIIIGDNNIKKWL